MKRHWLKILAAILLLGGLLYGWGPWSDRSLRASVEETRRQLRAQGFKTELPDFDLAVTGEVRRREEKITAAGRALRDWRGLDGLHLMQPIGPNVAQRAALQEFPSSPDGPVMSREFMQRYAPGTPPANDSAQAPESPWLNLSTDLKRCQRELDEACVAVGSGEFRFEPVRKGEDFLLPYLPEVKKLAQALSCRAVLALHDHQTDATFTNLLALTRLSTRWDPEPMEISHLVRFACVAIAQQALWEGLQTDGWNDAQLAELQREWESAHFFDGLPESVALQRASTARMCQSVREQSFIGDYGGWGTAFRQIGGSILSSPKNGFQELKGLIEGYREHLRYQNTGSYEDEKALLLYYRDREVETTRALACQTWEQMRPLPGVTNYVMFQGSKPSRIGAMMNLRQINLGFVGEGRGLLGRAAETEARRRLMVAAIALKRFQISHGENPESLAELVPALLPCVPTDFMDGKELRYQRFEDGRFVLYSVGLDCADNGGQMRTREQLTTSRAYSGDSWVFLPHQNTDLVWPMAAHEEEIAAYELRTDETIMRLNEILIQGIEQRYLPRRPEENTSPLRADFE